MSLVSFTFFGVATSCILFYCIAFYFIVFLRGCVLRLSVWLDSDQESMAMLKEDWGLLGQPVALVITGPGPHCKGTESREWGQGRWGEKGVTSVAPLSTLGPLKGEPGAFLSKSRKQWWPGFFSKPESEIWP